MGKEFNFKRFAGRDFKIAMKVGIFLSLLGFAGDNSNGQAMPPASPISSESPWPILGEVDGSKKSHVSLLTCFP
jgi:hypothetical protein